MRATLSRPTCFQHSFVARVLAHALSTTKGRLWQKCVRQLRSRCAVETAPSPKTLHTPSRPQQGRSCAQLFRDRRALETASSPVSFAHPISAKNVHNSFATNTRSKRHCRQRPCTPLRGNKRQHWTKTGATVSRPTCRRNGFVARDLAHPFLATKGQ